ncbi:MAG: hypothetical protein ACFFG0_37080 [Candidatus Thorarchaeota archaeon]
MQYIQPITNQGPWYDQLERSGPGVHDITFLVNDIDKIINSFKNEGISSLITFPLE